jgi:hypothetical protein
MFRVRLGRRIGEDSRALDVPDLSVGFQHDAAKGGEVSFGVDGSWRGVGGAV